jgi:hypothetical protein
MNNGWLPETRIESLYLKFIITKWVHKAIRSAKFPTEVDVELRRLLRETEDESDDGSDTSEEEESSSDEDVGEEEEEEEEEEDSDEEEMEDVVLAG